MPIAHDEHPGGQLATCGCSLVWSIEQKKAGGAKSTAFWHVCRAENTTTPILDLGAGAKVISAWL